MKKILWLPIGFICIMCVVLAFSSPVLAANSYKVFLGDKEIVFDVASYEVSSRLLAPVRAISEATGATVDWNGKEAIIYREVDRLVLRPGVDFAKYNDVSIPLDVAVQEKGGRLFLPLRFVCEWLQLQVDYADGVIYINQSEQKPIVDTLTLPKGNFNANLSDIQTMMIWNDKIYRRLPFYNQLGIQGLEAEYPEPLPIKGTITHFNLWENRLFFNNNNNFIEIDEEGNILQIVISGVGYCQIQDGMLYYHNFEDAQMYRRELFGGEPQALGIYNAENIVITDQHIYYSIWDGAFYQLKNCNLDGSNVKRLLTAYQLNSLEYAEGSLYFNLNKGLGKDRDARIYTMGTDGTGLRVFCDAGANGIVAHDGWLYYTALSFFAPHFSLDIDNGIEYWNSGDLKRIRLDGSGNEILAQISKSLTEWFSSPMVMFDGTVYYIHHSMSNNVKWVKADI